MNDEETKVLSNMEKCPECEGNGYTFSVEPECCGNLTRGGECRGDCAVPKQVEVTCKCCGGVGGII